MLDELLVDYETVDTLDETHNHNLRNVLKDFSDWWGRLRPTVFNFSNAAQLCLLFRLFLNRCGCI